MTEINQLYAGAAQVEITPPPGTRINGDFVTHFATRFHDPLFAKCLVLQNGHEILAWVIVDICVMSQTFIDPVKAKIREMTHIPVRNIMIASTHTHAAGSVEEVHLSALDMAYRTRLADLIPQAVIMAKAALQPAEATWGSVDVPEHVLCRRYHMSDEYSPFNPVTGGDDKIKTNPFELEKWIQRPVAVPDPELYYLAVRSLEGEWISLVGNYSLHYVGDWENGTISADYFGFFAKCAQEKLGTGDDFIAMMTNGTSGDVNIWDFERKKNYPAGNFKKSKWIGEDLATRVVEDLLSRARWERNLNLEVTYRVISQDVRKPDSDELGKARDILEKSDYENFVYSESGLRMVYAREQILLHETPDVRDIPLQTFRIGNLVIGALPGEFFAETGLKLKKEHLNIDYFTICLANGNVGYVPPAHEIEMGGYETWRCRYSCLQENAESKITEELSAMVKSISGEITARNQDKK